MKKLLFWSTVATVQSILLFAVMHNVLSGSLFQSTGIANSAAFIGLALGSTVERREQVAAYGICLGALILPFAIGLNFISIKPFPWPNVISVGSVISIGLIALMSFTLHKRDRYRLAHVIPCVTCQVGVIWTAFYMLTKIN